MLAGAFADGKGLKLTKEERREEAELAELKKLADPPGWSDAGLLAALRKRASEEALPSTTLPKAPIMLQDAIMRARAVASLEAGAEARWWAVLGPKELRHKYEFAPPAEEAVICLGQDGDGKVRGAIGWWPAVGPAAPLRAADASAIVLLEDDDGAYPSTQISHPTVVGIGENNKAPEPVAAGVAAPAPLQLAEVVRLYLVGRSQVNARLQRGGAGADEKTHIKALLAECHARLAAACAAAEAEFRVDFGPEGLNRVESAVSGVRKMYLSRPWEERCVSCGTRHSVVEVHSCKFWVKWKKEAAERREAAAAAAAADKGEAA